MTIIKDSNRTKIEQRLRAGEGRATKRTMSYDDLVYTVEALEEALDPLPKAMRVGATGTVMVGEVMPNSYAFGAEETACKVVRRASGWALEEVFRSPCAFGGSKSHTIGSIILSARQADELHWRILASRRIKVQAESESGDGE